MKKIAVTQRLIINDSYFEIREALDINLCKLIRNCNLLPIPLPINVDFKDYFKSMEIEGLILSGGNDLFSQSENDLSKSRDSLEFELIKYCLINNIPIFGICRGMQIIAEYFASTFKKVDNEVNNRFDLIANPNSIYYTHLSNLKNLNSFHDFTIDKISEEFIISGTNKNGIIKAIEHKTKRIFGQMWHSERESKFRESEVELIKFFFNTNTK